MSSHLDLSITNSCIETNLRMNRRSMDNVSTAYRELRSVPGNIECRRPETHPPTTVLPDARISQPMQTRVRLFLPHASKTHFRLISPISRIDRVRAAFIPATDPATVMIL